MALGFYDAALKEEPNSILALLGHGAALQKMGRGQEAQADYDAVLKFDPQNREALTNMTSIIGERAPQEALNRLLELERQYALFSPVKAQIGLTYAKMGSLPQALDYFRRAVALAPDTVMYHYNLALVLDHLGRRDQAVASYERVLASISAGRSPVELSATEIERRVRFLRAR
jgi:protein O-GlcNAc transferase